MLQNIEAKTYKRNDLGTKRVGFIANEIERHLPDDCDNIVGHGVYEGQSILTMDYSRLTPILWTLAKKQQEVIANLTTRLDALEKPKKKGANKIPG